MALLNFQLTPASTFAAGFLRGMAAPCALFGASAAPALPQVVVIEAPGAASVAQSLANDWGAIRGDFVAAIELHGKTTGKQG